MTSSPVPGRTRPRWAVPLLVVLVVAAAALAGFEVYAGHYQPLTSAGYLKPLPSPSVHRVSGSGTGTDFAGPAGAHLRLEFGLVNDGPFDVQVSAVTALPGSRAGWSTVPAGGGAIDPAQFRPFSAAVSGRSSIRVLLDVVLPSCSTGRATGFDTVSVHWSALGRRHVTPVALVGDIPITLCGGA